MTSAEKNRVNWLAAAFALYVAGIALSNWLITHVGIPTPFHTFETPVGFGLMAPSGVWAAAVSFPARDFVQRTGGRWLGIAAILAGAGLSFLIASPVVALASAGTYLLSESLDMAVYSPLQRRWFVPAVLASGAAAVVLDSFVFLHWAGLYTTTNFEGQVVGKAWVILAAAVATYALRKRGPLAVAAA